MTDHNVTFNGQWYEIETPAGNRWTFDPEDLDETYIHDTLWAWSRLLDYVKEISNVPGA